MRTTQRDRGFTLVETVVVLAVMSIIAAMAIARTQRGDADTAVSGLTRQLSAMVQLARYTARSTGSEVRITLQQTNPVASLRIASPQSPPADDATWAALPVQSVVTANQQAQLLNMQVGAVLPVALPGSTTPWPVNLTFLSTGTVQYSSSASTGTGASIYLSDTNLRHMQALLVYARTGYPKVIVP